MTPPLRIGVDDARGPEGMRLYAIGDVHGRLDLLEAMHERIVADIAGARPPDWRIIHLGDYTDRGPAARGVLDFLIGAGRRDERVLSLAGNHDLGLLEFLEFPDPDGLFANHGGAATALSYGVAIDFRSAGSTRAGRDALATAVPEAHLAFIRSLPRRLVFGDFFFCHAGIRPGVPLAMQDADDLVLIRRDFLDHPGLYEKVVVHGHTPVPAAEILPNRINVDTGAFRTGRLSAVMIDGAEKRLMEVAAPDGRPLSG